MENLLAALKCQDNALRAQAEATYNEAVEKDFQQVIVELVGCLKKSQDVGNRMLCAILLRQIVRKKFSATVGGASSEFLKTHLVKCLEMEQNESIRKKIAGIFTVFPAEQIAVHSATWLPHFLQILETVPGLRISTLFLLEKLFEVALVPMFAKRVQMMVPVTQALTQLISQNEDLQLQIAAGITAVALLRNNPDAKSTMADLGRRVPKALLDSVATALSAGGQSQQRDAIIQSSLEALTSLADKCFWAFEPSFGPVCVSLVSLASPSNPPKPSLIRSLSCEILIQLFGMRGKLVLQDQAFLQQVITCFLSMQCEDSEFEEEWEDAKFGQEVNLLQTEDILLRSWPGMRCYALGGIEKLLETAAASAATATDKSSASFVTMLFSLLQPMLQSSSLQQVHAALSTIGLLPGILEKKVWPHLKDIVNGTLRFLQNAQLHPRIRYAAAACLHELFKMDSICHVLSKTMHATIMPVIISSLSRQASESETVALRSLCLALYEYCSHASDSVTSVLPYLDELVKVLVYHLQNASGFVALQVNAMNALGALAKVSKSHFGKYYDGLMPGIKQLLGNHAVSVGLRRSAMLCVSTVAAAVGKEKFLVDAPEVINLLLAGARQGHAVEGDLSAEKCDELENVFEFSKQASALLGRDFEPYLVHIVPLLTSAASIQTELESEEIDDLSGGDVNTESQQESVDETGKITMIKDVQGRKLQVKANVFALQLRLSAISAIDEIADSLGAKFLPYADHCAGVVVKAIAETGLFQTNIKAAEAGASLLHAACCGLVENKGDVTPLQRFLVDLVNKLMTAFHAFQEDEDNDDRRIGYISAIERCVRICYYSGNPVGEEEASSGTVYPPILRLPLQMIEPFTRTLVEAYGKSVSRRIDEVSRLQTMGYDLEDAQRFALDAEEIEIDLCTNIVDSIGWIIKVEGADFLPTFNSAIAPSFRGLLTKSASDVPPSMRHNALCLFSDVIEFCGPQAIEIYGNESLSYMLQFVNDPSPELRLATAYAIGVCAQKAPAVFAPKMFESLEKLSVLAKDCGNRRMRLAQGPTAELDDDTTTALEAGECAISTIGKICRTYLRQQDVGPQLVDYLKTWLGHLPLRHDNVECVYSHGLLVDFVEEMNPLVMQHPTDIIRTFGAVLVGGQEGGRGDANATEMASQANLAKIPMILRKLSEMNPENFSQAWNSLEDERSKAVIQQAIQFNCRDS